MKTSTTSRYDTKDLYLAAYLIAIGYTRYSLTRYERQFMFTFEGNVNQDNIEIDVAHYWDDDITVSPKQVFNGFKELKYRMHQGEISE